VIIPLPGGVALMRNGSMLVADNGGDQKIWRF
jgi:hypothetical protein